MPQVLERMSVAAKAVAKREVFALAALPDCPNLVPPPSTRTLPPFSNAHSSRAKIFKHILRYLYKKLRFSCQPPPSHAPASPPTARFLRFVRPAQVRYYDAWYEDGGELLFVQLEYLAGGTLRSLAESHRLTEAAACRAIRDTARCAAPHPSHSSRPSPLSFNPPSPSRKKRVR